MTDSIPPPPPPPPSRHPSSASPADETAKHVATDPDATVTAPPYRPPAASRASPSPPDPVAADAARVEHALDEGDLGSARVALGQALARHGQVPRLLEVGRRLDELERVVARPQVEAQLTRARERLQSADYPGALSVLDETMRIAPDDPTVASLRESTERAAARHADALERERAVEQADARVRTLLESGSVDEAAEQLRTAARSLGRHDRFDRLDRAIDARRREQSAVRAQAHSREARRLLAAGDWSGALDQAEQALQLDPDDEEARSTRDEARTALRQLEGARVHADAVTEAREDVERMIEARELPRARRRLKEAVDQLGEAPELTRLAARIDAVTKDQRFRQRIEWAERRANEAEALVAEAGRRSLGGDFAGAVERLERARTLDPGHPEIDERLATARTALERRRRAESEGADRAATVARVEALLDAVELDAADGVLRQAARRHGDDEELAALGARLAALRRAEEQTAGPLDPTSVAALDPDRRRRHEERQRLLAAAYSWKQALLFPLRGRAAVLTASLAAALLACDLVGLLVPLVGAVLWTLTAAAAVVLVAPVVARVTVAGHNLFPTPRDLVLPADGGRAPILGAGVLGTIVLALGALPSLALLASRPWTGVVDVDRPLGWWLLAAAVWIGSALGIVALASGATFGTPYALRLPAHLRALAGPGRGLLLLVALVTLAVAAILVARLAVLPLVWWLGALPADVTVAILAVGGPHWIGVLVRRERLRWADAYA